MTGATLGPYRLDRELGAGGMGKVWAARVEGRVPGLDVGRVVALKVVHPHLLETPGFFKRFLREAEIGKAVVHENVVRTFDCDSLTTDGKRADFLVMEYVEGQTLRSLLDELERVPEELCRHIGREVTKGLAAIHAAGVVHRDMKPENVLITSDHQIKVMDLGVARLQDEAMRLSQTGAFVGSIHYAAPESFREGGKHVDGRADLHALGLVLYELSCGVNPYVADDVPQILRKVLHEEPRRLGDVNPQLSPFFEEVVHTLLAKDPAARFADAAALVAVLDEGEKSAWWTSRSKAIRDETKRPLRRIRIPRETAVYGRENEIALLRSRYARATEGDGQVVLIEGEAGIGKSRVVDELVGRLQRDGEDLHFLSGSYPPGGAATAAGAFSTAFREQLGDADLADALRGRLGPAATLAPAFAALLLGGAAPTGAVPLTKDSLQTCFVAAARSLAAERPTVLLIDDLHFATDEARALFTSLAMAVPGHRLLLVGTTRPGADEKWIAGLTRLPQTSPLPVGRLGPKDLIQLLQDSFRSEALAASLSAQIALKSDGNPFFAFEIIRGLREGRFITQTDEGTWVSTRVIEEIEIPSSVLDLVKARVADLTEEERDLLDVASCWGFEFDATLVGEALGAARVPTLKRFAQIEKKHRLVRCAGERFAFDHHQVQEALYGALPPQLAREYHAALAAALETRAKAAERDPESLDGALCVDLCEHFLRGARGASALRYFAAAQTRLQKGFLHAQFVALTERALAAPDLLAGAERAQAVLRLAGAFDFLGRRARQEECAREAERLAEAAGDDALRLQAALALGLVRLRTSRNAEAEGPYLRALELARVRGDTKAGGAATRNLGNVALALGRIAAAQEFHERSLALARESGDRLGEAIAVGNLGIVLGATGRLAESVEHFERHLALAREIGDREGEARATGNLGSSLHALGRYAEALEAHEKYLVLARELGDRLGEAVATGNVGIVLRSLGRPDEARERAGRHLALSREIGDRAGESRATACLGEAYGSLGRLADAREQFERNVALAREIGEPAVEALAMANLGIAFQSLGRLTDAKTQFESSLALARRIGDRRQQAVVLDLLAESASEEDDAALAERLHTEAIDIFRSMGARAEEASSVLARGSLLARAGRPDEARKDLGAALATARELSLPGIELSASARLARLPGGEADPALAVLAAHGERAPAGSVLTARLELWRASGDRAHLVAAKRLLDEYLALNPPEFHEAMRTNVRVNREILAACREAGL